MDVGNNEGGEGREIGESGLQSHWWGTLMGRDRI